MRVALFVAAVHGDVADDASVCEAETTGGYKKNCTFPFIYKGISYEVCTTANHGQPWCAYHRTDTGELSSGEWANCLEATRCSTSSPDRRDLENPLKDCKCARTLDDVYHVYHDSDSDYVAFDTSEEDCFKKAFELRESVKSVAFWDKLPPGLEHNTSCWMYKVKCPVGDACPDDLKIKTTDEGYSNMAYNLPSLFDDLSDCQTNCDSKKSFECKKLDSNEQARIPGSPAYKCVYVKPQPSKHKKVTTKLVAELGTRPRHLYSFGIR